MLSVSSPVIQAATIQTPIGPLTMLAADGQVCAAGFTEEIGALVKPLGPTLRATPVEVVGDLGPITDALAAYFEGDIHALDSIAVTLQAGAFKQRVWTALRAIPPGRPTTYRDLAIQLGGPTLARAVGMANATNPIAPIIPCHRVIGSDGRLKGYYWAIDRKRWLLDHERRHADRHESSGRRTRRSVD